LLHPSLLVNRVRTWRSSSEEPNIQNFPKHDEQHKEIRDTVEAPPGHCIVAFDFGQIQARNVAQESDDKALVESMWQRHDIHADWRDRLLQLHPDWAAEGLAKVLADKALLKHYRQEAKNKFVFASFFGASGRSVAGYLGVPERVGEQLSEEFWDKFSGVKRWHQQLHRFYDDYGYVTGLTGFRRYAPVARTEIINTPIQSDEAMIVFDAYCRLVESQEPQFVPNLMVHDDLTFVWPKDKIDAYAEHVIGAMLNCSLPWAHKVPVLVEMSVGRVWSQLQEAGAYESDRWHNGTAYRKAKAHV
jgi:DNA polymerase-1